MIIAAISLNDLRRARSEMFFLFALRSYGEWPLGMTKPGGERSVTIQTQSPAISSAYFDK